MSASATASIPISSSSSSTLSTYMAPNPPLYFVPLLHGYDLYWFVQAPNPPSPFLVSDTSTTQPNPEYVVWHKQDQLLLGWLRSSLSEQLPAQVVSCTTSASLWSMLHQTFSATSQARLIDLQQQLQFISKGGMTCAEYIQKVRSLADELAFIEPSYIVASLIQWKFHSTVLKQIVK